VIVTTPGGQRYFRVAYSRKEWDRAGAWYNLLAQSIPGCPKVVTSDGKIWLHGWVKDHSGNEWAWIYWCFPVQDSHVALASSNV